MKSQDSEYVALAEDLSHVATRDVHIELVIFVFTQPLTSRAAEIHPLGAATQKLFLDTSSHHSNVCLKNKLPQLKCRNFKKYMKNAYF